MKIENWYLETIRELDQKINIRLGRKNRLGIARLCSFFGGILLFYIFLKIQLVLGIFLLIAGLGSFLYFLRRDIDNQSRLKHLLSLKKINELELQSLHGDHSCFAAGDRFKDAAHPYSGDLDVFGDSSLFQFINRTTTEMAEEMLAASLSAPAKEMEISLRQHAIRELQKKALWRQDLQALGQEAPMSRQVWQRICNWLEDHSSIPGLKYLYPLSTLLPVCSTVFIILIYIQQWSWDLLWIPFILHAVIARHIYKIITPVYNQLSRTIEALNSFENSLAHIEKEIFENEYLQSLQAACGHEGVAASSILKKLKKVLARLDYRFNPLVYFPLQLFVFWDIHQYRQLIFWKEQYRGAVLQWMHSWAMMEMLSSFGNLAFNHADWTFPQVVKETFLLSGEAVGHPLLPEGKRVCNDVGIEGSGKLMLLTGSNMAGKSTFLRTVGVNMVLALAGAPVCAKRFITSRVMVYSSMRIADNLEENISTFYAELKKLEVILQRVRAHEKVFLLLDEILRGTNSQDRHIGSRALIRQLITEKTVGIIATHDLALTGMTKDFPGNLLNFHFDVQVKGEELFFDYKLKEGICNSMNASLLMRKIGLDI